MTASGAKIVEIDMIEEVNVYVDVDKAGEVSGGLDVLINNADVGVMGIQETFTRSKTGRRSLTSTSMAFSG